MADFTEKQRARLQVLKAKRDAIMETSGPLREARDRFANEARAEELRLNAQIRAAEKGLAEINEEYAFLARALGTDGAREA